MDSELSFKGVNSGLKMIVTDQVFLRQKSRETSLEEVGVLGIVQKVKDLLPTAWTPGIGLAAVQIGYPIRAAVYFLHGLGAQHELLLNPVLIDGYRKKVCPKEGCLSIPGVWTSVMRYEEILFYNNGQPYRAEGYEAQLIAHEIDHMDGILNIDKVYHSSQLGRNAPCHCGSGKKYKHCCLEKLDQFGAK